MIYFTTMTNGPAHGAVLNLGRNPKLLRVVIDPDGKVDALDQIYDVLMRYNEAWQEWARLFAMKLNQLES